MPRGLCPMVSIRVWRCLNKFRSAYICLELYIYIYMCVCVCVWRCLDMSSGV